MKNPLIAPELREIIVAEDSKALRCFCEAGHAAVVAELIFSLSADEAWAVLKHAALPPDDRSDLIKCSCNKSENQVEWGAAL
jgi:hypothetical protein